MPRRADVAGGRIEHFLGGYPNGATAFPVIMAMTVGLIPPRKLLEDRSRHGTRHPRAPKALRSSARKAQEIEDRAAMLQFETCPPTEVNSCHTLRASTKCGSLSGARSTKRTPCAQLAIVASSVHFASRTALRVAEASLWRGAVTSWTGVDPGKSRELASVISATGKRSLFKRRPHIRRSEYVNGSKLALDRVSQREQTIQQEPPRAEEGGWSMLAHAAWRAWSFQPSSLRSASR
jgi:hypothetical protein